MTFVIHLMRHASHGHLGRVLTGRQPGVGLSPIGHKEALALARHMAALRVNGIYCSPRRRARETARYIMRESGAQCSISAELDEIDFGHWAGKSFSVLALDPQWRHWNDARDTASTPGGETMDDVAARIAQLVGRLRRECTHGTFGLITHSDVIKAALCYYQGWSFNHVHSFEIGPASISTLSFHGSGSELLALNVTPAAAPTAEVPA